VEGRYGREFVAVCGARCYPLYGSDPTGRLARHPRCSSCILRTPPESEPRAVSRGLRAATLFAAALCVQSCTPTGDSPAPAPNAEVVPVSCDVVSDDVVASVLGDEAEKQIDERLPGRLTCALARFGDRTWPRTRSASALAV
jgi:hypothetical protein